MKGKGAYKGKVTSELRQIYLTAYEDGIWLCEWGPAYSGNMYMAAAGSLEKLAKLEKQIGRKIDSQKLDLGDIVNYDLALPGLGKTRENACRNAIKEFKLYKCLFHAKYI